MIYGGILLFEDYSQTEIVEIELDQLTSINLSAINSENPPVKRIKVNFDTLVIFQGDVVGVTATASGIDPNVKAIAILFTDPSSDIPTMTKTQLAQEIDITSEFHTTIQLLPTSDPPFNTRAFIPFFISNQQIVIYAVVWTEDGGYNRYLSKQVFAIVQPRTDKLQSETNQLIQQQIEKSGQTNILLLGLGWIGIMAIPILMGVDVLLRIHFDSK